MKILTLKVGKTHQYQSYQSRVAEVSLELSDEDRAHWSQLLGRANTALDQALSAIKDGPGETITITHQGPSKLATKEKPTAKRGPGQPKKKKAPPSPAPAPETATQEEELAEDSVLDKAIKEAANEPTSSPAPAPKEEATQEEDSGEAASATLIGKLMNKVFSMTPHKTVPERVELLAKFFGPDFKSLKDLQGFTKQKVEEVLKTIQTKGIG